MALPYEKDSEVGERLEMSQASLNDKIVKINNHEHLYKIVEELISLEMKENKLANRS